MQTNTMGYLKIKQLFPIDMLDLRACQPKAQFYALNFNFYLTKLSRGLASIAEKVYLLDSRPSIFAKF